MSETDGEDWVDTFLASGEKFEEEHDDLEAILEGEIGFHTFFVAEGDDPTRGVQTAIYQGLYDRIEEVHIDADLVEMNYGEVTPETVREETLEQISHFTYLPESIAESIGDRVEERVRKNMNRGDDQ